MTLEGKALISAPKGAAYAIEGGGWLAGQGLFDVRYEISAVRRHSADHCDELRVRSFATDTDGCEYRLEQNLATYELYRLAVAEPLLLRRDELRGTDFGGRARRTTENVVLRDLRFNIDSRDNRPVAVLSRPAPGQGAPTVTYFLFREKYATGRFSLAWVTHVYDGVDPSAPPIESLMLYLTLDGDRLSKTATVAGLEPDRPTAVPIGDDDVLASRLNPSTLIWRRWREPEGAAAPTPFVLTRTGRVAAPSTALRTITG
jgi:hypothetical protein